MACGVSFVAESLQGDGEMRLALPAARLQPELAGLAKEEINRVPVSRSDRLVLEEEAAAVEIESVGGIPEDIVVRMGQALWISR